MSDRHFENAVQGFCPMGCGQTLYRSDTGRVWCDNVDCPDDAAVHRLLEDQETHHVVQIGTNGWTARHPMYERIGNRLMTCTLLSYLLTTSHDHISPGEYRAMDVPEKGIWRLEKMK